MRRKTLNRLAVAGCFVLIIAALNLGPLLSPPEKYEYSLGEKAEKSLYAPISFKLLKDKDKLRMEQDSAAALVLPVLLLDEDVERKVIKNLHNLRFPDSVPSEFSSETREILVTSGRDVVLTAAENLFTNTLAQGYFFQKDDSEFSNTRKVIIRMGKRDKEVEEYLSTVLGPADIDTLTTNSARRAFPADPAKREALTEITLRILVPNLVSDDKETGTRSQAARERISIYEGFVERGELILDVNSKVDESVLRKIEALNAAIEGDWKLRLELLFRQNLFAIIIILLFGGSIYILRRDPPIRDVFFVTILLVTGILANFALRRFSVWWFMPAGFIALSATLFLSPLEGIMLASATSLLFYLPWQTEPEYLLYALLSGFGALLAFPYMRRRIGFAVMFAFTLIAGIVARGGFLLAKSNISMHELYTLGASIGINAFLNFLFFVIAFFLAERIFGYTSPLTLNELANLNRNLFKEFSMRAAGSYHHSIVVGNLAEGAARIIGANPALALTGGYYHDIGKMAKPQYFIENQLDASNPHDSLKPRISALILTSHVKEGLVIAERNHLPRQVMEIIREHHGTTRMESFYKKHLENPGDNDVPESDFRYQGPKPQRKESALVMLADSVEAAVRSKGFADRQELEQLVKEIIDQKVSDGQLDECSFTTADIQKVRRLFTIKLLGIFHPRIQYAKKNNHQITEKDTKKRAPRVNPKSSQG